MFSRRVDIEAFVPPKKAKDGKEEGKEKKGTTEEKAKTKAKQRAKARTNKHKRKWKTHIEPPLDPGGILLSRKELLARLSEDQSKSQKKPKIGLMCLGRIAETHPAGDMLHEYAAKG